MQMCECVSLHIQIHAQIVWYEASTGLHVSLAFDHRRSAQITSFSYFNQQQKEKNDGIYLSPCKNAVIVNFCDRRSRSKYCIHTLARLLNCSAWMCQTEESGMAKKKCCLFEQNEFKPTNTKFWNSFQTWFRSVACGLVALHFRKNTTHMTQPTTRGQAIASAVLVRLYIDVQGIWLFVLLSPPFYPW